MRRSVSDTYVIECLLQGTQAAQNPIVWQETGSGRYITEVRGVHLELERTHSNTGSRVYITLSRGLDKVYIEEPRTAGLFGHKYETEDQRHLAASMNELASAIGRQCVARKIRATDGRERIKEMLYRRLLFEESGAEG